MLKLVHCPNGAALRGTVQLTPSKSHSNRLLALQLYTQNAFAIQNLSDCDDTRAMEQALNHPEAAVTDVDMAGTAMRFLTAAYAITHGSRVITGGPRMLQRPVAPLVDALRALGAKIRYTGNPGFPPLEIHGVPLAGGAVDIRGDVSSQFISALMLAGPFMPQGLIIRFSNPVLSRPYVDMTAACLRSIGAQVSCSERQALVQPGWHVAPGTVMAVEQDWSAAAFWLQSAVLAAEADFVIVGLQQDSMQGDARAAELWGALGLTLTQEPAGVRVQKTGPAHVPQTVDFIDHPDLALPYAATVGGLGATCRLTGLDNLRIKESDRITALATELAKAGVACAATANSLTISGRRSIADIPEFDVWNDHRMAMCLAPLSLVLGKVAVNNPAVVAKSYPGFWRDWDGVVPHVG